MYGCLVGVPECYVGYKVSAKGMNGKLGQFDGWWGEVAIAGEMVVRVAVAAAAVTAEACRMFLDVIHSSSLTTIT